jgi:hypothetical protein
MPKTKQWRIAAGTVASAGLVALTLLLNGCQRVSKEAPATAGASGPAIPAGITGINHTSTYISSFYVNEAYGGNISKKEEGGGGGTVTCCLSLPERFKPGQKVHVSWNASNTAEDHWQERDVEVDPYPDGGGNAWVNFLPDGRVRIIVTAENLWGDSYHGPFKAPSHPAYQGADKWPALQSAIGVSQ